MTDWLPDTLLSEFKKLVFSTPAKSVNVAAAAGPAVSAAAARTQAVPIIVVRFCIAISFVSMRNRSLLFWKNGRVGGVEATPPSALLSYFTKWL